MKRPSPRETKLLICVWHQFTLWRPPADVPGHLRQRWPEIAAALDIAEVTVKLHVSHLMDKLEAKDRTEAATIALQRGIIRLD